jgi:hypothetical protein
MEKSYAHSHWSAEPNRFLRFLRIVGMVFLGLAFAVAFALIFGLVVKLLWNWLMPALFGLSEISYWQAFGIVILAKILFSGFGHRVGNRHEPFRSKFSKHWPFSMERIEGKDWKYYSDFWRDEGKAAFEAYVRKVEEEKQEKQ